MPRHKFTSVDEYIQTFPKETQKVLEQIRKIYKKEIPNAEEVISYNIPCYKMNGKYVLYFAGYAKHVSIYPLNESIEPFVPGISKYVTGPGTAQFKLSEALPVELITEIVRYKVRDALAKNEYKKIK